MEKEYLYELHCHTSETSKCSKINSTDIVRFYYEQGFSGICVTDHFFNGNTSVPRNIQWKDRVEQFCIGYEKAKNEGDKLGIDVFFGWEYSYMGTDFLTYCLDKQWLLEHPEVMDFSTSEYCDFVHSYEGFIAQAHPFREAGYIEMIRLLPRHVDAVETINACRTEFENKMADMYADMYNIQKIAASDNHLGALPQLGAMCFNKKMHSLNDICNAIKNGNGELRLLKMH